MAEEIEVDEFGIPIKGQATVQVDEFGIPLKKKDDITVSPEQSTSGSATVSGQGGEQPQGNGESDELLDLPQSYKSDRKNYSELIGGKKYKLKRGGVDVFGVWDAENQNFVVEPLLNTTPQVKPRSGIAGMVEEAVNPLKPKFETEEDVISRNYSKAEETADVVAKKATEIQSLTQVPLLQQLDQLKRSGASEEQIKSIADTPIESKDIPLIRFEKGSEGRVYQNLNVNLPTEEYKGEVMGVPLKKILPKDYADVKTIGELYDKVNEDYAAINDYRQQIDQFNKVVNEKRIENLPQEDKEYLSKIEGTPMYEEELAKTLERNGSTENLAMGFGIGLSHKLKSLYSLGDNIGLSNEKMAEKQRAELAKEQLFGVQPKGAAEITSMLGSFAPDIALGAVTGGYGAMASMLSTLQRDKIKEYYANEFSKGVKTPDQTKAWEYATASTAKEVPFMLLAGKLAGVGSNVVGRNVMKRAYELTKDVVKKASADAFVFGGLSGFSQNKINKLFDVAEQDDYIKSGLMYALMGAGFGLAHGLKGAGESKITSKQKNEVDYIASYLPENLSQNEINNLVKSGKMLPSEGEEVTQRMANYRQMRAQIPTEITFEQAEKIYPLWEEKTKLQSQMDGASGEFKKVLQGQLQDVDRKIMTKAAVPLSAEEKAQRSELIRKEAKGESIDKPLLKYLNDRYEAAKEIREAAKEETIKRQQEEEAAKLQEQKTEQDDKENITRVSGEIGIGQEPVETQPIEEGSGGEATGGGILEKAQEVEHDKYEKIKSELPKSGYTTEDDFKNDLENGEWALLTAENPNDTSLSAEENAKRNEQAEQWLIKKGYKPQKVAGKYNRAENSFYVKGMTKADAIAFANIFGQENVATDKGLYYQDGSFEARIKGGESYGASDNYVSAINVNGKPIEFSVEFSKDKTIPTKNEKQASGNRLFSKPLEAAKTIADRYAEKLGFKRSGFEKITKANFDKERAKRIAKAFDEMQDNPNDPQVKAAYEAMAKETLDQYREIMQDGYVVEVNNNEPYSSSEEMIEDLRDNKRMKIFSTESGFGDEPITEKQRQENPLLRDSGFKDVNGVPLLINDVFRFVHDFFGHSELGNSFGELGEENAWNVHARMYSPLARRAMTTETRGQNSWVNSSGINKEAFEIRDKARKLREVGEDDAAEALVQEVYDRMKFAEQKVGLLPEEFSELDQQSGALSDLRGSVGKIKYPDVVFGKLKTKQQAERAIQFYQDIINKFNKIFDRGLKIEANNIGGGKFKLVVEYETGLKPKYFEYPTGKIGEHIVSDAITNDVPMTSLRHELIHEMLVKNITDKFERINNADKSAEAKSIDDVQRGRAYNYTLEDVFYERVVEAIEREPDNVDTFDISTFGEDVTNKIAETVKGKPTKDAVMKTLKENLDGDNVWLKNNLMYIFDRLDYGKMNNIKDASADVGAKMKKAFDNSRTVLPAKLYEKIKDFTEYFNEQYESAKQDVEGIKDNTPLFEAALNERTEKKRDKALKNFGDKEADARRLIEDYDTNIEKLKAQGIEPTGTKAEVLADMLSGKYDAEIGKTKLQKAKERLAEAKKKRSEIAKKKEMLGISQDPFEEAKEAAISDRELFDAYVEVAKEYIKEVGGDIQAWAKELGEEVNEMMQKAWDEASKDSGGKKKRIVTERAYEGEFRESVKKELERIGLTREIEAQEQVEAETKKFINRVGLDAAIEAVRAKDVEGAAAMEIISSKLEDIESQMLDETAPDRLIELSKEQAQYLDELDQLNVKYGRGTSYMKRIYAKSDLGYNVEKIISNYKEENNGEISKEVEDKFRELDKQLKETNKKLKEAEERLAQKEAEQAVANIKESVSRKKTRNKKEEAKQLIGEGLNDLADALGVRLMAVGDKRASIVTGLSKIGRGLILNGEATIDNVAQKVREYVNQKFGGKFNFDEYEDDFNQAIAEGAKTDGKIKIETQLIRDWIEKGVENIDQLVYAIKQSYPNATSREIRDAITGYGKIINPTKDEISVKIRKLKDIGRIISALEDIENGKRPMRSGLQRDKPDAEQRAKRKELREALKELPIDEADLEHQLKTQLDAAKQRLQNQIEDLERQIQTGQKDVKSPKTVKADEEMQALVEKRDALKKEYDEKFKDDKYAEEKRLELAKRAAERRIAELQRRLKEGDFSKKEKKPMLEDTELTRLKAEKLRIKEEYDREFYKAKLRNRTLMQRAKDYMWDAWGLTRALSATADLSFVGVQGWVNLLSHPIQSAKAFGNAIKFMSSEARAEQWLNNLKSQEWYPILKDSKLSITEPKAEMTAREELFNSGWTNVIWDVVGSPLRLAGDKAYQTWVNANPMKALERASVGYLDTIRVQRFLDGMQMLEMQGKTIQNDKQAYKNMADVINTFTGRASLGAGEQIAPQLTKVFFSPRNWASILKQTILLPRQIIKWQDGQIKPSVANKMAISDLSKALGLTSAMVMMAAAALNEDDDPETSVETDPTSSDFGKLKFGRTRVDPWGGRIQQVILASRLITDSIKRKGGKTKLGEGYGSPTREELIMEQAFNKLSPSAQLVHRYLTSKPKGDKRVTKYGEEYEFSQDVLDRMHPIIYDTVKELLEDDPNALDGLLIFYAMLGGGVNTYQEKKRKKEKVSIETL